MEEWKERLNDGFHIWSKRAVEWFRDIEGWKRRLNRGFWLTLAVLFLIESWLWDHLKEWLRAVGHELGIARIEPWLEGVVAKLSPQRTLLLFALPAVLILPFKFLALSLIAHGHVLNGLIAIILAKTFALGVTAFLFDICRDKLMQMQWFCRFYSIMLAIRAWAHALVAPFTAHIREVAGAFRARIADVIGHERYAFDRRLARLRQLARAKLSA